MKTRVAHLLNIPPEKVAEFLAHEIKSGWKVAAISMGWEGAQDGFGTGIVIFEKED